LYVHLTASQSIETASQSIETASHSESDSFTQDWDSITYYCNYDTAPHAQVRAMKIDDSTWSNWAKNPRCELDFPPQFSKNAFHKLMVLQVMMTIDDS
jgi:hypothetical protein